MQCDDATARRAIAVLDLTSLNDGDDEAAVRRLCAKAATPEGPVAAICIWPRFVPLARPLLAPGIRLATVANFPAGADDPAAAAAECAAAIAAGAQEVDVVVPWRAGPAAVERLVAACRAATAGHLLKTILETGMLPPAAVEPIARAAVAGGADMLKTSTGKAAVSATPEAAAVLLAVAAAAPRPVGVKVAGGIRTAAQAAGYLAQADAILGGGVPGSVGPRQLRIGASGLLDALLAQLGHGPGVNVAGAY